MGIEDMDDIITISPETALRLVVIGESAVPGEARNGRIYQLKLGEGTARTILDAAARTLLTDEEHKAMELSGQLAGMMRRMIGDGPCANGDWAEVAHDIHHLQERIMAQAAARAFPEKYRIAGGTLESPDQGSEKTE